MMVQRTWDGNRLLWRALALSLGLHLLLALFLPVWTAEVSGGLQPVEAVSFARVLRVQIARPAAKSLPAAVPQTKRRAPTVSFARNKSELAAPRHRPTTRPIAETGPAGTIAAAPHAVSAHSTLLYARPTASAQISTQQAPPAPSPAPQVTQADRSVAGAGANDRGGVLPLGASQDPVLDPGVRDELQKRFSVGVTLIVTVGEDGKTERVVFQPPIDARTEHAIEAILADASWDAAVCGGGVSCEGTARITLSR